MINIQCKFLDVLFKLTYTPSKIKHKISKNISNQIETGPIFSYNDIKGKSP